ncbi:MAG TPA: carbohydrate ABC transporter permease [Candidatus Binatia bacterium]|nr:carbohydrate ABC transporter permease [Candidatus Binatia bacterium]
MSTLGTTTFGPSGVPGALGEPTTRPASRRRRRGSTPATIAVVVVAAIWFFPIYYMIIDAFKPSYDLLTFPPQLWPSHWTLSNFQQAFTVNGAGPTVPQPSFLSSLFVSLVVSLVVVLFSVAISMFAALAAARFNFRGRGPMLVALLVAQMVPFAALLIPIFIELNKLGLIFTLPALIIAYVAPVLPFTIWTLRGFVAAVPADIEEAALTDGCSRLSAFRKVIFPLIAPGLVATSIFAFLLAWNDFAYANIILGNSGSIFGGSQETATVWLVSLINPSRVTPWGELFAASLIFTIPVMVFFLVIQRRLAAGLTAGAVKA